MKYLKRLWFTLIAPVAAVLFLAVTWKEIWLDKGYDTAKWAIWSR